MTMVKLTLKDVQILKITKIEYLILEGLGTF